jgi:hypothetical protein
MGWTVHLAFHATPVAAARKRNARTFQLAPENLDQHFILKFISVYPSSFSYL